MGNGIERSGSVSPIIYDEFGSFPEGEKFFSSVNRNGESFTYGKTYMPTGFSQKFQDFFEDAISIGAIDALSERQRKIVSRYYTENINMDRLGLQEHVSATTVKEELQNGIR